MAQPITSLAKLNDRAARDVKIAGVMLCGAEQMRRRAHFDVTPVKERTAFAGASTITGLIIPSKTIGPASLVLITPRSLI